MAIVEYMTTQTINGKAVRCKTTVDTIQLGRQMALKAMANPVYDPITKRMEGKATALSPAIKAEAWEISQ